VCGEESEFGGGKEGSRKKSSSDKKTKGQKPTNESLPVLVKPPIQFLPYFSGTASSAFGSVGGQI